MHKSYPFYNLSHPVGKGGSNYGDDVWLVQYMLVQLSKHPALAGQNVPKSPLPVNGVYSAVLDQWILWFQQLCLKNGLSVATDSRIDPLASMPADGACSSALKNLPSRAIIHLNATFRRRYREKHDHLEAQPELAGIRDRLVADEYAP